MEPTYCSRELVKLSLDAAETARSSAQIDRVLAAATEAVDGQLRRGRLGFSLTDATRYWDWPALDAGGPWRLWLDQHGLISVTSIVAGGVTLDPSVYYLAPVNDGPPYNELQLLRSTNASFTGGSTPQKQVAITGTWGCRDDRETAGTLVGTIDSSTGAVTLSAGNVAGVGDLLIIDSERMVVQGRTWTAAGTLSSPGLAASAAGTTVLGVTAVPGETLLIDAEAMLVVDVAGSSCFVKRAWDGSVLAAHTAGTTAYVGRGYTVQRAKGGTLAASHADGAAATVHRPVQLVRDLCLAEAVTTLLQEQSGFARTVRLADDKAKEVLGRGLTDLREQAMQRWGRQTMIGAI